MYLSSKSCPHVMEDCSWGGKSQALRTSFSPNRPAQFHSQRSVSGREMQEEESCCANRGTLHWSCLPPGMGDRVTARRGEWGICDICYISVFYLVKVRPGPKPSAKYSGFKLLPAILRYHTLHLY